MNKKMSDNGVFKGKTQARLDNIENQITFLRQDLKGVMKQIEDIDKKLSRIYGFAGGVGAVVGIVASFVFDKIFN